MDEDQHYERFDMDNDYEGGEWIGGEFFHQGQRKRKMQTREEQLYGSFLENSDDEYEHRSRRGGRQKADYSKPVGFVSSGVIKHDQDETADDAEREEAGTGGLGLGAGAAAQQGGGGLGFGGGGAGGGGLGFQTVGVGGGGGVGAAQSAAPAYRAVKAAGRREEEEEEEEEEEFLPTAFGKRIKQAAEERRKRSEQQAKAERAKSSAKSTDIGKFEQHTRGIGAKLLAKMGYEEGKGLGRNKQGISRPIEAKLRPKGMGMGFGDRTEPKMLVEGKEEESKKKEAQQAAVDVKKEAKLWKRRNAEQRAKRSYKTADELLEEAAEKPGAAAAAGVERQTIIDMRGPQARVVSNLEHLNVREEREDGGSVPMPELQHNLRLLVDLAEADIQRLDAKLRHEKDTAVILGKEQERLEEEVRVQAEAVDRMAQVVEAVTRAQAGGLTLAELEAQYRELRVLYREEYLMYNLAATALAQVLPLLSHQLQQWSPLQEPSRGGQEFLSWRHLLESEAQRQGGVLHDMGAAEDPFMRLVAEVLLPPLRKDLTNNWDPRDAAQLERFMEVWEPILPPAALQHIMEHLVLPRLRAAVSSWDPLSDTVALHTWVHPWLPFLGQQMAELWPVIRFKFANALQAWHPSDQSAHIILAPWHKVFDPRDWEQLLARSIVPKLAYGLQELVINPVHQELEQFNWVMAWQDVMPASQMVSLLEQYFFPKWHAVLRHWLSNSPDYDEVTRWYLGWKSLLPEDILEQERVRAQMGAALNLMNTAVDGRGGAGGARPSWQQAEDPLYGNGSYAAPAQAPPGEASPPPPPHRPSPPLLRPLLHLSAPAGGALRG